jgi:hypothetical protein
MGKKHRNRINSPKKNNHIPKEAIIAEHEAHGDEKMDLGIILVITREQHINKKRPDRSLLPYV